MLGWIIGMIAVTAITIVTLDLLGNDEIFNGDLEDGIGTGGIFPYDSIEALSCETEVQFTDIDKARSILAVQEIWDLLGKNPVRSLTGMDAETRINTANELHRRLCTRFSLNLGLEMGESEDCICGYYCNSKKKIWIDYRFLLSNKPEYIYEYLDTVIHEFRHAMQYCFIEDRTYNNGSDGYCRQMAVGLHPSVYVSFAENPELYNKQLCERDAREYAAMVMQMLKGDES
ncbi:hypothetical protein CBFG_01838 [Clostridiales bacterium 1_7_47FAA]|uniref:Uncharacterized protein n=1 Tax=Enterocloster hominis (ex Hitch et al. 2024) TaxID=1917870 RepID=A0ABV1D1E9_9FIRM|nr:hypothetical protein [Lachnoclostridium pacaense]EEQ58128.1 hypothetical protein CBFG_01838 [Clostridiales bacterium 1_7_47FAA]MCC2816922.1 hypothetical protein [Lachnoclostridium pacaense]